MGNATAARPKDTTHPLSPVIYFQAQGRACGCEPCSSCPATAIIPDWCEIHLETKSCLGEKPHLNSMGVAPLSAGRVVGRARRTYQLMRTVGTAVGLRTRLATFHQQLDIGRADQGSKKKLSRRSMHGRSFNFIVTHTEWAHLTCRSTYR